MTMGEPSEPLGSDSTQGATFVCNPVLDCVSQPGCRSSRLLVQTLSPDPPFQYTVSGQLLKVAAGATLVSAVQVGSDPCTFSCSCQDSSLNVVPSLLVPPTGWTSVKPLFSDA